MYKRLYVYLMFCRWCGFCCKKKLNDCLFYAHIAVYVHNMNKVEWLYKEFNEWSFFCVVDTCDFRICRPNYTALLFDWMKMIRILYCSPITYNIFTYARDRFCHKILNTLSARQAWVLKMIVFWLSLVERKVIKKIYDSLLNYVFWIVQV